MDERREQFERAVDPRHKDREIGPLPPEASTHPTVMDRRRSREQPKLHFKRLAATWSGIVGVEITPAQCCLMLATLKMVREWYMHDPDNITDAEGYLSLIDEVKGFVPSIPDDLRRLAAEQVDRS